MRFVIKMYPYRYRDFSHIAAEAALAARDQGRFWEMYNLLLERYERELAALREAEPAAGESGGSISNIEIMASASRSCANLKSPPC